MPEKFFCVHTPLKLQSTGFYTSWGIIKPITANVICLQSVKGFFEGFSSEEDIVQLKAVSYIHYGVVSKKQITIIACYTTAMFYNTHVLHDCATA